MDLKTLFSSFLVLFAPRLILRVLRPNKLDDLYTYASDPEIDQYAIRGCAS